jgi:hypothetical protein
MVMSEQTDLPPLPTPKIMDCCDAVAPPELFTADQMQEYARLAKAEEAYIIEMLVAAGHVTAQQVAKAREIVAAIRKAHP